MDIRALARWVVLLGMGGVVLVGCGGGKSSSSTAPSGGTSGTLRRVEGRVVSASTAQAPAGSVLARLATIVLSPREVEAAPGVANCTVSAPGATTVATDGEGKFVLVNVPTNGGRVTLTFNCPGQAAGQLTLEGLAPNSVVTLEVDVRPGRVTVRTREVDPSPSVSQVSPVSKVSVPRERM